MGFFDGGSSSTQNITNIDRDEVTQTSVATQQAAGGDVAGSTLALGGSTVNTTYSFTDSEGALHAAENAFDLSGQTVRGTVDSAFGFGGNAVGAVRDVATGAVATMGGAVGSFVEGAGSLARGGYDTIAGLFSRAVDAVTGNSGDAILAAQESSAQALQAAQGMGVRSVQETQAMGKTLKIGLIVGGSLVGIVILVSLMRKGR